MVHLLVSATYVQAIHLEGFILLSQLKLSLVYTHSYLIFQHIAPHAFFFFFYYLVRQSRNGADSRFVLILSMQNHTSSLNI